MTHRLNTNKQFMIGNGILAFAVIFVVVIFVYMSLKFDRDHQSDRHYAESYEIVLTKGFLGDSLSILINDSVCASTRIDSLPTTFHIERFTQESTLMIVDNETELMSIFELSEKGGEYAFEKGEDGIKQLARHAN